MTALVLIAGSGNVTGHGVIEALTQADWQLSKSVAGYDCCNVEANAANMFCTNYQVPKAADPRYASYVLQLIDTVHPRVVIPSNDHDLRALLSINDELVRRGVTLNGAGPHTHSFLDKRVTSELFSAHNVQTPKLVGRKDPLIRPYVVRKREVGQGKKFTVIVESIPDEENIPWELADDLVITQFVEGQEFTIDILCNQRSQVLSVVPRLRRQVTAGIVTFGEVVNNQVVIERSRELASKLQLKGINCVQCIYNDTGAHFFEVNPRPGSGTSLTTHAGVNMPRLWFESLYGDVTAPEPDWGLKMVRYHAGRYFK